MTEPLTPADCDLRDFQFIPLDIVRLFGSEFHARANDSQWRAGVTLWLKSFHQVPAASLPDDDVHLARAAEFGRDLKAWKKVREVALHGWIKCDDGRLYHPVVAEKALEGWIEKLRRRMFSAQGNAKRHKITFDQAPFDCAIDAAAQLLRALNPQSRTLRSGIPAAAPVEPPADGPVGKEDGPPESLPQGSQETSKGSKGTSKGLSKKEVSAEASSAPTPKPPESPAFIALDTNERGKQVVITEAQVAEFRELYPVVDIEQQLRAMRAWLISNPGKRKTAGGMLSFVNKWLAKEQDRGGQHGQRRSTGNGKGRATGAHQRFFEGLAQFAGEDDGRAESVQEPDGRLAIEAPRPRH